MLLQALGFPRRAARWAAKNSRKQGRDDAGRLGKDAVLELVGAARQEGRHAVRFLPVSVWPEHALFVDARDAHYKRYTGDVFPQEPGTATGTHAQDCKLEHTSYVVAERTYLVEDCIFHVPKNSVFLWSVRYWGAGRPTAA